MSGQASHAEHSHGSVKSYVIGLILSIVLTIIPFGVVMTGSLSTSATLLIIVATAVAQVLVQLILFMHMSTKTDEGWNFTSFVFTVAILVLVIGGSLWIMYNLHLNMMIG
ncbi:MULTISPECIES: cytochrome o ubiquinol oxidase subunit IV [Halomonas]|jgi:cytochrome o ubiquinol oxidase operon protein cyoD|uniref:Cytochrome bo(3) ubiquinol oxidase subunit 4 n=2 Tax=Halomonas TaxID=2745 RepID=A0ABQ0U8Z3_9GAMM|nr:MULTISPECIES: cytochrome o ubiquinol oxidase subunit IV [Halomonas]PSJ22205.1 cytochrome o ubiquinol oxidase subunit IV [Halomonas sp. ND22Bw]KGE76878.1 cytochrome C oxidase [Halomonas salina]MDR5890801.1 cytochrome o ubiquinol oxidase subunit IV [Halomonas salina]QFT84416.1 Cytochrome bo(3) ubiquinol oxidase subunit 4 [Halomonas sp. THAF12]RAH38347.1 cytochrome o ubiquinol oxidase subunit IV [Halomonas sp. SL1]